MDWHTDAMWEIPTNLYIKGQIITKSRNHCIHDVILGTETPELAPESERSYIEETSFI